MKKIYAIFVSFIMFFSISFVILQAGASKSNTNNDCFPDFDDDWDELFDFHYFMDGSVTITGKVLGFNSSEGDESSAKPLDKASVTIRLLTSNISYSFDDIFNIDLDDSKPDWYDESEDYSDESDDCSDDIDMGNIDDILSDCLNVNFSSSFDKKYSIDDCNEDLFQEISMKLNPLSDIDFYKNYSWDNFVQLWRFAFTNENGEFEFDSLQPGTYEIKASRFGYESSTKIVTIEEGSENVEFLLKETQHTFNYSKVVIPINETLASIREMSGQIKTNFIDNAIINGSVGCEILVEHDFASHVVIYSDGLTINATNISDNKVSLKISGDEDINGKTIVINVQGDLFYDPANMIIEYDGEAIRMADDLEDLQDILNPDDDGSHPEYLVIHGANGTQIIVSIPHFSEHEITVYSLNPVAASTSIIEAAKDITAMIALYAMICIVAAIFFIGIIGLRKRLR